MTLPTGGGASRSWSLKPVPTWLGFGFGLGLLGLGLGLGLVSKGWGWLGLGLGLGAASRARGCSLEHIGLQPTLKVLPFLSLQWSAPGNHAVSSKVVRW